MTAYEMRISDWSSDVCSSDLLGLRIALLTGRDKGKARAALLERLAGGEVDILVGTHALFQEDVVFHDLALAVIDEQHRFGVSQRLGLAAKGQRDKGGVDVLVMTATPIPRTLSLTAYGDMDVSLLTRSEEHQSELQSLMRTSYAVFCL